MIQIKISQAHSFVCIKIWNFYYKLIGRPVIVFHTQSSFFYLICLKMLSKTVLSDIEWKMIAAQESFSFYSVVNLNFCIT